MKVVFAECRHESPSLL